MIIAKYNCLFFLSVNKHQKIKLFFYVLKNIIKKKNTWKHDIYAIFLFEFYEFQI